MKQLAAALPTWTRDDLLKMDEPNIRLAGARALCTRPWTMFRGTAEQLSADPDPEVAAVGKGMLARIQEPQGP